jgi:Holliday junction resolvase RusA-like endonuclease
VESPTPDDLLCEFTVAGVPISAQTSNKTRKQAWMAAVTAAAQAVWLNPPLDVQLAVNVTYFEPGSWKLDLDNMVKPIS